ncbi:MAG: class II glutamine amidotransferase [Myxococcota bacterium]|nr:class II glutamine amidotransferase [Myxococcota bacterium]
MCRLLGIASSEATDFKIVLRDAPRSLAALSRDHRDGWGLAVFDEEGGWRVDKGVACASEDARFHSLAVGSRGEMLVSHVRQKTIGETSLVNTHPFKRGRWVFAHNGTVKDIAWLHEHSSAKRLAEVCGETDSELLFAWLLTCLDQAGVADAPASSETDHTIGAAAGSARQLAGFGAFNFLLSDGVSTYAHRFGRSMFLLERGPCDAVRVRRTSPDGTVLETPWSPTRSAVIIASEKMTDEPWEVVEEGMLLRIDRLPTPRWRSIGT